MIESGQMRETIKKLARAMLDEAFDDAVRATEQRWEIDAQPLRVSADRKANSVSLLVSLYALEDPVGWLRRSAAEHRDLAREGRQSGYYVNLASDEDALADRLLAETRSDRR